MNQADLTERYDALQETLMTLYEEGPKTIEGQIMLWETIRREQVLLYYGRKEGLRNFGLQPIPALAVSEYKAKEAILQVLLLKSLQKSAYGREEWTLTDTSAELTHTAPRNTFKKNPYIVYVYFDHKSDNAFPYTQWEWLYVQNENDEWYKTPGLVDINGLYFEDEHGDKSYFQLFATDAQTYGTSGGWTVKYKNETISTSAPVSSSQRSLSDSLEGSSKGFVSSSGDTVPASKTTRRKEQEEGGPSSSIISTTSTIRRRRGRHQQGKPTTNRSLRSQRGGPQEAGLGIPASEVGRGHRLVPRTGPKGLARLKAEAGDPPVILVKGAANCLKCWRNRCYKANAPCLTMSTVFRWAGLADKSIGANNRMLIAFQNKTQRQIFLDTVTFPKGVTHCLGFLDSL
uniref:Regulatory protein E2 n=1 Tax=Human papillomavirus TaxID=10566 RepID=A0A385PJE9_9PAPI|nr:MAG: E2 protein [Human papillomavirus]